MTPKRRRKVTRICPFPPNGLKWRRLFLAGGRNQTLKCQGDKKRHLKILSLATHTHVVIQVTKERTSFCEGVFTVCRPGREVQLDNECAPRGTDRGRTIFIHPPLPPSLTNQAWNGYNIKRTRFYSIPSSSRWGTIVISLLRKFLQWWIMTNCPFIISVVHHRAFGGWTVFMHIRD